MGTNWLWDKNLTEDQAKAVLADSHHREFISYAALLLSRTNSAKEIFRDFISKEDFFVFWTKIKRQMRKDSWNDPRIDYWQAIYDTLKEEMRELKELKTQQFQEPSVSPIPREIALNIKTFREQSGLTQKDLAEKLNISQQIISRIEGGKQNLSSETIDEISKAIGVSFEKLVSKHIPEQTILQDQDVLLFPKDPDEFEDKCLEIIIKSKEYSGPQRWGGVGDQGVDIIAFKYIMVGRREKWYFQCKRHQSFDMNKSKKDLDKIKEYSDSDPVFKPDGIVFIVACSVTPGSKIKIKEYARSLGFDSDKILIWDGRELKARARSAGVELPIPVTKQDVRKASKDGSIEVIKHITSLFQQTGLLSDRGDKNKEINDEIDGAVQFIHFNSMEKAEQELFRILGKIDSESKKYKTELVRIYNNLGVRFNRFEADGGDFDEAEKYFNLALNLDPNFIKAKINLAAAYLNKGGDQNYKRAFEIASPLWESSDKKDPLGFQEFIWAKFHHQSPEEAIAYYEKSVESQKLVEQNERLLNLMATIFLGQGDYKRAEELTDQALTLAPESPANLMLKARAMMLRAQTEKMARDPVEVIPRFESYEDIEKARELLERASKIVKKDKNDFLENQIRYDLSICLLWLRHPDFTGAIEEIDKKRLGSIERGQIEIYKILQQISQRNFEIAHDKLVRSPEWPGVTYHEKARVAHIFLLYGSPEHSKDIFKTIEGEAEQKRDVGFWIDMSLNEVLLGNKNLAIDSAQKAKKFSQGTSKEKMVLSHIGALYLRYREVDRVMPLAFELDNKYPEDKMLHRIRAVDEGGHLSEEFKSAFQKQVDWFEGIKKFFQTNSVPSYFLEKMLRRPYADILSFRGLDEIDFMIELNVPNESFENELFNNLNKAEYLVFDYASLLNLSKMNLLGHLEKFRKKILISRELFNIVQSELLRFEQEDLRNLWRFLRSSKEIDIVENIYSAKKEEKYSNLFDEWLIDSIRITKEKRATLIMDDLRLIKFFRSEEKLNMCNSFIILKSMLSRGWIDAKMYSTSLGGLAERFYIFLPFSGDDLFQIVMEDHSRKNQLLLMRIKEDFSINISLRSYHLVNQMFLPGSDAKSFTSVFVRFIDLLWKTGSLPEDKISWLHFLTKNVIRRLERQGGIKDDKELNNVAPNFVRMWTGAVQESSKDEILLLEKRVDKIFKASVYNIFKDHLLRFIKTKKTSLGMM